MRFHHSNVTIVCVYLFISLINATFSPSLSGRFYNLLDKSESILNNGHVQDSSTITIDVVALGPAELARAREYRQFRHSALQFSGRFIRLGQNFSVTVPQDIHGLAARVVLYGSYKSLPDQPSGHDLETHPLAPGKNVLQAGMNGMIHFVDDAEDGSRRTKVQLTGGEIVPTFVLEKGKWDETGFRKQVNESKVPFGMLVGERVMVEIQKPNLDRWLARGDSNITRRLQILDDVVEESDRVFGLSRKRDRHEGAYKAGHKIHVVNPDTGAGGASTNHDRISFHNSGGLMPSLLASSELEQWAFWHEAGHTYQPPIINWQGLLEVSANVPALANQERVNKGPVSRLDDPGKKAGAEKFLALPDGQRHFEKGNEWVRLLFFDQLRRAFGGDFYAILAQEMRVRHRLGVAEPSAIAARKDLFALTASRVANRNLNPWLYAWGFDISAVTKLEISRLPAMKFNIVRNRNRKTDQIEHLLKYSPPTGYIIVHGPARYGQKYEADGDAVEFVPGIDSSIGQDVFDTSKIGTATGSATVVFVSNHQDGQRNTASALLDVRRGSMIQALGLGDECVATIALMEHGIFRAFGTRHMAHEYYSTTYLSVKVIDDTGRTVHAVNITGRQFGQNLAGSIEGVRFRDNYTLEIWHAEPSHRLLSWSEDVQLPRNTTQRQVFKLEGTRLVRSSTGGTEAQPKLDLR